MTTDTAANGLSFYPMDQFIVRPLFGGTKVHWYTVTNATLWLGVAVAAVVLLFVVAPHSGRLVPGRAQSVAELAYLAIHRMVSEVCGPAGLVYFPWVMTLFSFILMANLVGLIPMAFTTTSHIAVTATLAFSVWGAVTIIGLVRNGTGFLKLFWPSDAPLALRPVLSIIEIISYCVRPISHSIRLVGNLMAGHAVIKVFATFAAIGAVAPISILATTAMYAFELLVAVIQAYVFTILTCVYMKDALNPGH